MATAESSSYKSVFKLVKIGTPLEMKKSGLVYCGNNWVLGKWNFANITKIWDKRLSANEVC